MRLMNMISIVDLDLVIYVVNKNDQFYHIVVVYQNCVYMM